MFLAGPGGLLRLRVLFHMGRAQAGLPTPCAPLGIVYTQLTTPN